MLALGRLPKRKRRFVARGRLRQISRTAKCWHRTNALVRHWYSFAGLTLFVVAFSTRLALSPSVHLLHDVQTFSKKKATQSAAATVPLPAKKAIAATASSNSPAVSSKFDSSPSIINNLTVGTSQFATTSTWSQDYATMPDGPLSSNVWSYDIGNGGPDNPGWGNNEDEYYTDSASNVRVENGELILEAQQQLKGGFDYTSVRLKTLPSLNFTYGKLDIVAKLPAGVGTWPAMWLLPSTGIYEPTTPAAEQDPNNYLHDGEIDMLEATGSIPGQITSSAQSYVYNPSNNNERIAETNVDDDTTAFHDYELQWTPTSLQFLVDGVAYHTVYKSVTDTTDIWPYNQPYYLILNIAMGGTEGGTEASQYPPYGIDNSSGPWEMAIRSISYYPYNGG